MPPALLHPMPAAHRLPPTCNPLQLKPPQTRSFRIKTPTPPHLLGQTASALTVSGTHMLTSVSVYYA